ncbi:MAG: hypothetical protein M5R38_11755 [Candidatus Methylomirabilis sp.]|nr:hypothetical protein [Candidatus Methylomirabilis sp.]
MTPKICNRSKLRIELRTSLRAGASKAELISMIVGGWTKRSDRGAEERHELRNRDVSVLVEALRHDPHLEIIPGAGRSVPADLDRSTRSPSPIATTD